MREELGDLLLQVLFHSVIAEERDEFDVNDVARGLIAKMKAQASPSIWRWGEGAVGKDEVQKAGIHRRRIPPALPPLHRAHRLQDRAAGVGFDWPDTAGPARRLKRS